MQNLIEGILDCAPGYKKEGSPSMSRRQELLGEFQVMLDDILPDSPFEWSTQRGGLQGNFGPIAWLRIFSRAHSPRATGGFYVVFLI